MPLLNWRLWVTIALVASHAYLYKKGADSVQIEFDQYKNQQNLIMLEAEKQARDKEHEMQSANQLVTQNYENLKTATATAVSALDADRLRLQSTIARTAYSDPKTVTGTNEPAEIGILGECLQRYESVAGEADQLSDSVKALQDYVRTVLK